MIPHERLCKALIFLKNKHLHILPKMIIYCYDFCEEVIDPMKKFLAVVFSVAMVMSVTAGATAAETQGCYAQRVCQEIY